MTTLAPQDNTWYSAHQRILFGTDKPFYPQGYSSVSAGPNNKAVFQRGFFTPYLYLTFATQMYIDAGPYKGFHTIVSYDVTTDTITTDTEYIGIDPPVILPYREFYLVVPFGYRVYYGYPSATANYFDVRAFHAPDGTAYVDIASILANAFTIQPPIHGYDENMYTHFTIDYIPFGAFKDILDLYSVNINLFTGWNYLTHTYYALNSAVPHNTIQSLVNNDSFLAQGEIVYFTDCCNVMSKIYNDRVFNFINCPDGEAGIGAMEIDNNFLVN
jgi:hypothetical protein